MVCTPPYFCRKSLRFPYCGSNTSDQWLHLSRSSRRGQFCRQASAASRVWCPSMPTSHFPRMGTLQRCFESQTYIWSQELFKADSSCLAFFSHLHARWWVSQAIQHALCNLSFYSVFSLYTRVLILAADRHLIFSNWKNIHGNEGVCVCVCVCMEGGGTTDLLKNGGWGWGGRDASHFHLFCAFMSLASDVIHGHTHHIFLLQSLKNKFKKKKKLMTTCWSTYQLRRVSHWVLMSYQLHRVTPAQPSEEKALTWIRISCTACTKLYCPVRCWHRFDSLVLHGTFPPQATFRADSCAFVHAIMCSRSPSGHLHILTAACTITIPKESRKLSSTWIFQSLDR